MFIIIFTEVPYIFATVVAITIPTIILLRKIRQSDVNSDAARGLVVESPTFLGYEGLDATDDEDEINDDNDNNIYDSLQHDYVPPPPTQLIVSASIPKDLQHSEASDVTRTASNQRLRSFIDKTNEMKKVPSVILGKYAPSQNYFFISNLILFGRD